MKRLYTLAALLFCACASQAQSLFYQFEKDNDQYYSIVGGTLVSDSFTENAYAVGAPGFQAFDLPLDDVFVIGKNGFVVNTNGVVDRSFAFDPLLVGLKKHATLASELRVLIYLPPQTNDSILIVEWENMGLDGMPDEDFVNFQLWLHRPSQTVELRYGQSQVSSDSMLAELGGVTADIALLNAGFSLSYEQQWIKGNPVAPTVGFDPNQPEILDAVPPAGTVYRFTKATTSSQQLSTKAFRVYPNPFTDYIAVQSTQESLPLTFSIYDVMGRLVQQGQIASSRIDTQSLQEGLYVLEMEQGNNRERVRLIKK